MNCESGHGTAAFADSSGRLLKLTVGLTFTNWKVNNEINKNLYEVWLSVQSDR